MTSKLDPQELERLQKDCGTPYLPTELTHDLRIAVSGKGPRAYDWADKPHRLLYDACGRIEELEHQIRTGQLVPAMPSDVDLVAEAECMKQMRETAQEMGYSDVLDALEALADIKAAMPSGDVVQAVRDAIKTAVMARDAEPGFWYDHAATAAITTYEAVSGVAKMRDALECADTLRKAIRDAGIKRTPGIYEAVMRFDAARAALGEKP